MQRERGVQSAGTLSFSRESDYTYQNIQSPVDQTVLSLFAILHEYDETTKQLSPPSRTNTNFFHRKTSSSLLYASKCKKKHEKFDWIILLLESLNILRPFPCLKLGSWFAHRSSFISYSFLFLLCIGNSTTCSSKSSRWWRRRWTARRWCRKQHPSILHGWFSRITNWTDDRADCKSIIRGCCCYVTYHRKIPFVKVYLVRGKLCLCTPTGCNYYIQKESRRGRKNRLKGKNKFSFSINIKTRRGSIASYCYMYYHYYNVIYVLLTWRS